MTECRCGWNGTGPHPCHACGEPSIVRFYNPRLVPLAGVTMKVQCEDTYACDACWLKFRTYQRIEPFFRFLRMAGR